MLKSKTPKAGELAPLLMAAVLYLSRNLDHTSWIPSVFIRACALLFFSLHYEDLYKTPLSNLYMKGKGNDIIGIDYIA